jgi:hypothetical protein
VGGRDVGVIKATVGWSIAWLVVHPTREKIKAKLNRDRLDGLNKTIGIKQVVFEVLFVFPKVGSR